MVSWMGCDTVSGNQSISSGDCGNSVILALEYILFGARHFHPRQPFYMYLIWQGEQVKPLSWLHLSHMKKTLIENQFSWYLRYQRVVSIFTSPLARKRLLIIVNGFLHYQEYINKSKRIRFYEMWLAVTYGNFLVVDTYISRNFLLLHICRTLPYLIEFRMR